MIKLIGFIISLSYPTQCPRCYWARLIFTSAITASICYLFKSASIIIILTCFTIMFILIAKELIRKRKIMKELATFSNHGIGIDKPMVVEKNGEKIEVTYSIKDNKPIIHCKNVTTGKVESFGTTPGERPDWFHEVVVNKMTGKS